MKRLLALLCTAALVGLAMPAHAGLTLKWRSEPLTWRTGNGGQQDSSTAKTIHTQTTYDTTKAFAFADYVRIPNYPAISSATDSLAVFAFEIASAPSSSITPANWDSTLLVTQVSMDATNWTTATPTSTFDATRPAGSRGAYMVNQFLTDGSTSQNFAILMYDYKSILGRMTSVFSSPTASTAPTDQELFGWKYIRWIVNGSGGQAEFVARFWHWTDFDD